MSTEMITSIIGGILVVIIFAIAIIYNIKTNPTSKDKDAAKKFLTGMSETLYKKVMELISSADLNSFNSLEEFESYILSNSYNAVLNYINSQLKKASEADVITSMILKVLNSGYIEKFINEFLNDIDITSAITQAWNTQNTSSEDAEAREILKKDMEEHPDQYVENSENIELEKASPVEPTEEELSKIIPPTDEEDDKFVDDGTSEIVEDDVMVDKRGRKRSKKTGRYV